MRSRLIIQTFRYSGDNGIPERKLQLVLDGGARFTLNSTNTKILIKHYGTDTASWIGKPVVLWFDESITYSGRMVGGTRVRVPRLQEIVGF